MRGARGVGTAMSPVIVGLWLFGGLLGGHDGGCPQAADQAARTLQLVERQWPLRPPVDPVVVYVQALGERLARADDGDIAGPWSFHVVRNLAPSAFALGGGQFVVSDGLIALVRGEDELAAVLAHEISHQQLGHFCRASSEAVQRIRLGSVVQHFDLDLEVAADAAAVRRLAVAGFDPAAMRGVLTCLAQRAPGRADPALAARREALGGLTTARRVAPDPAFEQIRRRVLEDVGEAIERCR